MASVGFAEDGEDNPALMGSASVLEKKDSLPGAEGEASFMDGDHFTRAGQRHT